MKFLKIILLAISLFTFNNESFADRGCILNNQVYTHQLPNIMIRRSQYYSQEYENYNTATINATDVAYWADPSKCMRWAQIPNYPLTNAAELNGCLINGNPGQVGRVITYQIINYCNTPPMHLPLDDYTWVMLLGIGGFGAFVIAKKGLFGATLS